MSDLLDLAEHLSWGTPAHTPLPGRPPMPGLLARRREPRTDWTDRDAVAPDTGWLRQIAVDLTGSTRTFRAEHWESGRRYVGRHRVVS